jgi:hypothetical protein
MEEKKSGSRRQKAVTAIKPQLALLKQSFQSSTKERENNN